MDRTEIIFTIILAFVGVWLIVIISYLLYEGCCRVRPRQNIILPSPQEIYILRQLLVQYPLTPT